MLKNASHVIVAGVGGWMAMCLWALETVGRPVGTMRSECLWLPSRRGNNGHVVLKNEGRLIFAGVGGCKALRVSVGTRDSWKACGYDAFRMYTHL